MAKNHLHCRFKGQECRYPSPEVSGRKPIDTWIALWGFIVTVILFLAPRTPTIVGLCLLALFGLVVHPVWTFWWIEKSLTRRVGSILIAWMIIAGMVISTIHYDSHERLEAKADSIPGGMLNPMTSLFTVRNGGGFPFSSYDFYCSVINLKFTGMDLSSDITAISPGKPRGRLRSVRNTVKMLSLILAEATPYLAYNAIQGQRCYLSVRTFWS